MKALTVLAILLVAACTNIPMSDEEWVTHTSDIYLCSGMKGKKPEEIRLAEINRRGIVCADVIAAHEAVQAKEAKEAKKAMKAKEGREKAYIAEITRKPKIRTIEDRVLADSIDQYNIVRNNGGSNTEKCVYAGMVKAAAAQAKNSEFYRQWNDVEKLNCAIAEWVD